MFFVNLIYGHFDILRFQYGRIKKVALFQVCAIVVLYLCGNLYFVREVHVERWKHLNHYITVNIYIEILGLFSSLHCLFFYIDPEMGGGGRLGERFKMSAHSPF